MLTDTPAPRGQTPTILVVDDSAIDRRVAGRVLEKSGWVVAYAADGALALERIAAAAPTLVVTDMQMPNLDGLALVEQIRERFPRIPVILIWTSAPGGAGRRSKRGSWDAAGSRLSRRRRGCRIVPSATG